MNLNTKYYNIQPITMSGAFDFTGFQQETSLISSLKRRTSRTTTTIDAKPTSSQVME